jgi:hypothetical protein
MAPPKRQARVSIVPRDDDEDTRRMPKWSPEELHSVHELCKAIDTLAAQATPWQVASHCASALAEALSARAVIIHQHDAAGGEIRVIGVHGPNAGDLLGTTMKSDDDFVVTVVLTNEKPLFMRLDGTLPSFLPKRHRVLGTAHTLSGFPVLGPNGCAAILEIVDAGPGRDQRTVQACEVVGARLVAALDPRPPPAPPAPARSPSTFPKRTVTLLPPLPD